MLCIDNGKSTEGNFQQDVSWGTFVCIKLRLSRGSEQSTDFNKPMGNLFHPMLIVYVLCRILLQRRNYASHEHELVDV